MTAKTAPTTRNVLILLGSPREDGNSTRLAFALADAACAAGHHVQSVRLAALRFSPCDACDSCRPSAKAPCVLDDDFSPLYPMLRAADVLVLATPLHFFAWSTPIKKFLDRLTCVSPGCRYDLSGRQVALIASAAAPEPAVFAGLRQSYRLLADYMRWTNLGEVLVPGVEAEGAVDSVPGALEKAAALARKIC